MRWLFLLVGLVLGALGHFAYDAAFSASVRTDLQIYRDAETGCEYVRPAWSFAGLTPRNDSLGVPICKDEGVDDKVEKLLDGVGEGGQEAPPAIPGTAPR